DPAQSEGRAGLALRPRHLRDRRRAVARGVTSRSRSRVRWALAVAVAMIVLVTTSLAGADVVRVDPATKHVVLSRHLEVLEDETAAIGIDDVVRPEVAARFRANGDRAPNIGF